MAMSRGQRMALMAKENVYKNQPYVDFWMNHHSTRRCNKPSPLDEAKKYIALDEDQDGLKKVFINTTIG